MVKTVKRLAEQKGSAHVIFTSPSKTLQEDKKSQYLKLVFPKTNFTSIEESFSVSLEQLKQKYKNVVVVVATEQVSSIKKSLRESVEIVTVNDKDPDMNDSKMKSFATKGLYEEFKKKLPSSIRELDGRRLMNDVRVGMGLEPVKEQINLVKDTLREKYFRGEIFNEGDIVESNGAHYTIVKRGSNHLLLKEESGELVSKWIHDVKTVDEAVVQPSGTDQVEPSGPNKIDSNHDAKAQKPKGLQKGFLTFYNYNTDNGNLKDAKMEQYVPHSVSDEDEDSESDLDAKNQKLKVFDPTEVGNAINAHNGDKGAAHLRRMKIKHHLGESYEAAENHKEQALKAKARGDKSAFNAHMANHHDALAQWHDSKGRHNVAATHAEKADHHHEASLNEAKLTAAMKLQKAFQREQERTAAARKRGDELLKGKNDTQRSGPDNFGGSASHTTALTQESRLKKFSDLVAEGNGYDDNRTGFAKKPREDDEYHNDPKPKFKAKSLLDRPHTVHIDGKPWKRFDNGHQAQAAAKTLRAKGKKANAIAHFKEEVEAIEESMTDSWTKVQSMDKGSVTGSKEEAKKRLAYLTALHAHHKKFGNDTKKVKSDIESLNRSRLAEEETKVCPVCMKQECQCDDSHGYVKAMEPTFDPFFAEEEEISETEIDKMLESVTDQDIEDLYEEDELAIIDEETGEELPVAVGEDKLDLMEVLSRQERMRAKVRLRRTEAKRERSTKVALKRYSDTKTINKRARRLAIKLMKQRMLRGRDASKISVGEKERIERTLEKRKEVINRIATKLVSRVRKTEKARMSHGTFTKPAAQNVF